MNVTAQPSKPKSRFWSQAWILVLCVALPPITAWVISGKSIFEKTLTSMAQPMFVVLVVGFLLSNHFRRDGKRWVARFFAMGSLALWIASCPLFVGTLMHRWESQLDGASYRNAEPFDYVVVLGGGTGETPFGEPQLTGAGDRVALGARLYHTGKARKLVTTGDILKIDRSIVDGRQSDPSQSTKKIWQELGVKGTDISELPGQNTMEEIKALSEHPEYWREARCGILTSAAHLPRAMLLAKQWGVRAEPIAADYRSGNGPITVVTLLPDAGELSKLHGIAREWIAMQIRR